MDVEMLLKTSLEKSDLSRSIKYITGDGIIFAPGMYYFIFLENLNIWTVVAQRHSDCLSSRQFVGSIPTQGK